MTAWLVVGGGTAGCVVAGRLSEHPGDAVTLLEAGPDHDHPTVQRVGTGHADVGPLLTDPTRLRDDLVVARRRGGPPVPYLAGRGIGGTALVNGGLLARRPAPGVALPAEPAGPPGSLGAAVSATTADAHGVLVARRDGRRVTTADAYLEPARDRSNLHVIPDTLIDRLLLDGRRVVGARADDGREWTADRVVVCAGAIATPVLLLRSGIAFPGVGEGLQDHPATTVSIELVAGADPGRAAIAVVVDRPGRQIVVMDSIPGVPGRAALLASLTAPTSVGRVALPDPDGPPLIELDQLTTVHDREGLTTVMLEALDLLASPAVGDVVAAAQVDEHGTPAGTLAGDRGAVAAWLPDHLTGHYHAAGSCRPGTVVATDGAVLGHTGLYLCDASVLPGVPTEGPFLATVELAERTVRRWRDSPSP